MRKACAINQQKSRPSNKKNGTTTPHKNSTIDFKGLFKEISRLE
jgi:hypothetical protein